MGGGRGRQRLEPRDPGSGVRCARKKKGRKPELAEGQTESVERKGALRLGLIRNLLSPQVQPRSPDSLPGRAANLRIEQLW